MSNKCDSCEYTPRTDTQNMICRINNNPLQSLYTCKNHPNLKDHFKQKKLTFEEWWASNKNMDIMPKFSVAKWLWNKAQENK
jgi:hypothetical protein